MKIKIEVLRKLIEKQFKEKNIPDEQIQASVDYLVWAEMSGNKTQ